MAVKLLRLKSGEDIVTDVKKVLKEFQVQLIQILEKIQTEDFVQVEDIKACEWCDYKLICNR